MSDLALSKFHKATSVDAHGLLTVNAGRYSRAAIVAAFEMIGGVDEFADWAKLNKTEFYTKIC